MWGPQVDIGWLHLLIPAGHLALGIPSKPPECHDRRRPPYTCGALTWIWGVPILVLNLAGEVGGLPRLQDGIWQMGILERENRNEEKETPEQSVLLGYKI